MLHNEIIEFLKNEKLEHIIIVKNKKMILDVLGDENKVSLDNKYLHLLQDSYIYHNHIKSSTFSFSDVKNMLLNNSKGIYLVTQNFLYYIERPKAIDWKEEVFVLENYLIQLNELANEEIEKLVIKENLDINEASLEKSHYIWLYIARIYEFNYKRKSIE